MDAIKDQKTPPITLPQAVLAPLLARFQAQVHAGMAFLSYLLQIGSPHVEVDESGMIIEQARKEKEALYKQTFTFEKKVNDQTQKFELSVPTLSLVPIAPLGIDSAEFEFDFRVENFQAHAQMQKSEKKALEKDAFSSDNRPWYLVENPINFSGNVVPPSEEATATSKTQNVIKIKITVGKQPIPSGLDKFLVSLNQLAEVNEMKSVQ